ncbi:helix-turn-helix transcriptional regulator [Methylobacterium sp. WL9]|uniref:helix-turn-helix domain-containing protein n=1 Tax=Methylobacterium sp. WL9 TaxID=2603898 RepID=UPI001FEF17C4|nr:helix-turn-helix transcriptional regulator [Methylobacterium sp. WL9]
MIGQDRHDENSWRPQPRFSASIISARQLRNFNDAGGIAVNFDVMKAMKPDINISGSQSELLSFWETRSASGFITQPKFSANLLTVRFITSGHIIYSHRGGDVLGSRTHATLAGFEGIKDVCASRALSSISGTIAVKTLIAANKALTGNDHAGLPSLSPVAEMTTPGMMALFCTVKLVKSQINDSMQQPDLILPMIQEIMSYQLLSAWPRLENKPLNESTPASSCRLNLAVDYIHANLSSELTLADIASIAGISVRSLQDKFRKEIGRTPIQFIIDQRLERAHHDLLSAAKATWSISDIARHWGFVHMSDFGQRYRRLFGCSPSDTRREAPFTR